MFDCLLQLAPTWVKLASRFNRTDSVVVAKVLNMRSCVSCRADDPCLPILLAMFVMHISRPSIHVWGAFLQHAHTAFTDRGPGQRARGAQG